MRGGAVSGGDREDKEGGTDAKYSGRGRGEQFETGVWKQNEGKRLHSISRWKQLKMAQHSYLKTCVFGNLPFAANLGGTLTNQMSICKISQIFQIFRISDAPSESVVIVRTSPRRAGGEQQGQCADAGAVLF